MNQPNGLPSPLEPIKFRPQTAPLAFTMRVVKPSIVKPSRKITKRTISKLNYKLNVT